MNLSLAMIVRNEAQHLARCLTSVEGLVDEIVVVDTGSDDDSREVARAHGAISVEFPWVDDFAAARNVALEHCRGDWVLQLDADEEVEAGWHDGIRSLIGPKPHASCWLLRIINLTQDQPPSAHHGSRLFQRFPGIRYAGRVHESIDQSLRDAGLIAKATNAAITHHGYGTAAIRQQKALRNLALHEAQLARGELDDNIWYYLFASASQLGDDAATHHWLQLALADHRRTGTAQRAELLIRLYQRMPEADKARSTHLLTVALELAPNQVLGRVLRAQEHAKRGEFDLALESLGRAGRVAAGEECTQITGDAVLEVSTIERWKRDIVQSRAAEAQVAGQMEAATYSPGATQSSSASET